MLYAHTRNARETCDVTIAQVGHKLTCGVPMPYPWVVHRPQSVVCRPSSVMCRLCPP